MPRASRCSTPGNRRRARHGLRPLELRYLTPEPMPPRPLPSLSPASRDTPTVRPLAREGIVTWGVSAVEIASAIEQRTREVSLSDAERAASWTEITELGPVRERAMRLVATPALRAVDAMQLSAALVAVSDRPGGTISSVPTPAWEALQPGTGSACCAS